MVVEGLFLLFFDHRPKKIVISVRMFENIG